MFQKKYRMSQNALGVLEVLGWVLAGKAVDMYLNWISFFHFIFKKLAL